MPLPTIAMDEEFKSSLKTLIGESDEKAKLIWNNLCTLVDDICKFIEGAHDEDISNKVGNFKVVLSEWDALITPDPTVKKINGLPESCLPKECYERLDNELTLTPAFLRSILEDRKYMVCNDYLQEKLKEKNNEKNKKVIPLYEIADNHYRYNNANKNSCEMMREKLEKLNNALKDSDRFFQKSSKEFKAMKDSLEYATRTLRSLKYRNYTSVNGADGKRLKEDLMKQFNDVLKKANNYLVYKQDGPTGFYGKARVEAAKAIRDQMYSLLEKNNIIERKPEGEILAGADEKINKLFDNNTRNIAGYLAPCSGKNFDKFSRFMDAVNGSYFDVLIGSRLDLVLDQLKRPDITIGLEPEIEKSKNNFTDPANAPKNANLLRESEGMSYVLDNMYYRIADCKDFDLNFVLSAKINAKLLTGISKDLIKHNEIIRENVAGTAGIDLTAKLYEDFAPYRDKAEKYQQMKEAEEKSRWNDKHIRIQHTDEETNLATTMTTVEDQNRMLAYSYVKCIAQENGMETVIKIANDQLSKDPTWTWEKMISQMRNHKEYKPAFEAIENEFKESEVQGKGLYFKGHVLRNYDNIMKKIMPGTIESIRQTNYDRYQKRKAALEAERAAALEAKKVAEQAKKAAEQAKKAAEIAKNAAIEKSRKAAAEMEKAARTKKNTPKTNKGKIEMTGIRK